jgi:D-serine dehydratase
LLGELEVRTVIDLLRRHPDLEFHFLVDSLAQLRAIEAAAATDPPPRKLAALIELGAPGGRTGLRTHDAALALARRVAASRFVALSGLECYEGLQISGDSARDALTVGALMQRVKEAAIACDGEGLFAGPSIILTAGGSAAFDIVARELPVRLSRPVLTILRSGCYVTHDSGNYERLLAGVKARSGGLWQTRPGSRRSRSGRGCSRSPSRGWRSSPWASATPRTTSRCRLPSSAFARGRTRPRSRCRQAGRSMP